MIKTNLILKIRKIKKIFVYKKKEKINYQRNQTVGVGVGVGARSFDIRLRYPGH